MINKSKTILIFYNGKNSAGLLDSKRFLYKLRQLTFTNRFEATIKTHFALTRKIKKNRALAVFKGIFSESLNRENCYSIYIMPNVADLLIFLCRSILSRGKETSISLIHNPREQRSSLNFIINTAAKFIQVVMFLNSSKIVYLTSSVKRAWEPNNKPSIVSGLPRLQTNACKIDDPSIANLSPKPLKLLILGRWMNYKSLNLLIAALKCIPKDKVTNFSIHILGSGYPKKEINEIIAVTKLLKIDFTYKDFFIPDEQIDNTIRSYDFILFCYLDASQSGFMQRAVELDKPIICTNVGGLREQLAGARGFCVSPNPVLIGNLLKSLIKLPLPTLKTFSAHKDQDLLDFIFS